jgi:lipoteichoic acid synthase
MLLNRQDWVYVLGLLIPFVVYNLVLKATLLLSVPGLAVNLNLILSDIFFNLGYTFFWAGTFAAAHRGPLRWVVVVLFHVAMVLVVLVTTCAYQYFQETGAILEYGSITGWIPKFGAVASIPFQGIPLSISVLLVAAITLLCPFPTLDWSLS